MGLADPGHLGRVVVAELALRNDAPMILLLRLGVLHQGRVGEEAAGVGMLLNLAIEHVEGGSDGLIQQGLHGLQTSPLLRGQAHQLKAFVQAVRGAHGFGPCCVGLCAKHSGPQLSTTQSVVVPILL